MCAKARFNVQHSETSGHKSPTAKVLTSVPGAEQKAAICRMGLTENDNCKKLEFLYALCKVRTI